MKAVGTYKNAWNKITGVNLPCTAIYQSDGLIVHIKKRHPSITDKINVIPNVIEYPDYIGRNPKEPNSIELVKVINRNFLVAVKLDSNENYLYVASLYTITDGTLQHRVKNSRLKKL